eukprot:SAG31_NODE_443_length_15645_cov_51.693169_11_plen_176_part_00
MGLYVSLHLLRLCFVRDAQREPRCNSVRTTQGEEIGSANAVKQYAESTMPKEVQDFTSLITDSKMFDAQLASMGIDTKKMPLGDISQQTVDEGFQVLYFAISPTPIALNNRTVCSRCAAGASCRRDAFEVQIGGQEQASASLFEILHLHPPCLRQEGSCKPRADFLVAFTALFVQ